MQLVLIEKIEKQERAVFNGRRTISVPVQCQNPYELYVHLNDGENLTMNVKEYLNKLSKFDESKLEFRRNQSQAKVWINISHLQAILLFYLFIIIFY